MPVCDKCEKMDATVNLRRRKPPHTGHWLCKDKATCSMRVQLNKQTIILKGVGREQAGA